MFTNTGTLSFWLSITFIAMLLCGLLFIYSIIRNDKLENDGIDKIIDRNRSDPRHRQRGQRESGAQLGDRGD